MDAKMDSILSQSGQSIIEFLFVIPIFFAFLIVMIKVNAAISISINNQRYARSQALWLTFNSPVYPELRIRLAGHMMDEGMGTNQFIMGVSDNVADDDEGDYQPDAIIQNVARNKRAPQGSSEKGEEVKEKGLRSDVRVRTTVSLCTQPNVIGTKDKVKPLVDYSPDKTNPKLTGIWNLGENTVFDYCGSVWNE